MRNWEFLGAPLAGIVCMHLDLGPADALSVGMFLQTLQPAQSAGRWSRAKPQRRKGGAKKNPSAREGSSDGQRLAFSSQPPTSRPTPRDKASCYGVLEAETATRNPA